MILKEDVDRYFEEGIPSPFMNTIRKAKSETKEKYSSVPNGLLLLIIFSSISFYKIN